MSRVHTNIIGSMGLAAVVGGALALPHTEERAVMSMRDGDVKGALTLLEELTRPKSTPPEIAMQIFLLEEQAGNSARAIRALEAYLEQKPDDVAALGKLADLYRATMQPDLRRRALERLIAIEPDFKRTRELLGLYRATGDQPAEARLMEKLIHADSLSIADLGRLGAMLAKAGDEKTALEAYRVSDARAPGAEVANRIALFELLVNQERYKGAADRAAEWSRHWKNPYQIATMAGRLARSQRTGEILSLARQMAKIKPLSDIELAKCMGEQGMREHARSILVDRLVRATPASEKDIALFVAAAAAADDHSAPIFLLRYLAADPEHSSLSAFAAEETSRRFGREALAFETQALSYDVLKARPVFGAETALWLKNPDLARRILLEPAIGTVPADQIGRWVSLLTSNAGAPFAVTQIRALRRTRLSPQTLAAIEVEAHKLGIDTN